MTPRMQWLKRPSSMVTGIGVIIAVSLLVALMPLPAGPGANVDLAAGEQPSDFGAVPGTAATGDLGTDGATAADGAATADGSAGGADGTSTSTGGATAAGTSGGAGGPAAGTASNGGPAAGSPGGGATSAAGGATYQGVTADSVLWGVSAQENGCGGFNQNEVAGAYGIQTNPRVAYAVNIEYWNKYPLTDFPLPAEIRKHVNRKNGYWGRKIKSVFRDSGGFACQDVGRANAVRMAEQDKVFGLIQRGNEGPEVPMSLVMAQHKLIHIGRHLTTASFQRQRAPYFYDGFWGTGEVQNTSMGSWICRDWKGGRARDTGDPLVTGKPRVFGITRPEGTNFDEASAALKAELNRCGVKFGEYAYPADVSTMAANVETVVSRMKRDGVTTLLSVDPFISVLLIAQAADKQRYFPEWVRSGFSDGSHPIYYKTFMTESQARNAWAAADAASIKTPSYYKSEPYLAWKKIRPNEEPVGDWDVYYYQFKTLAMGMAGAGPNLTPLTFGQGLARVCSPCPRANPLLPLEILGPDHPTNRDGFTLVKWNPNKPCPICKPDGEGNPTMGYFDFPEKGKRYGRRITDPDPG